jgi:hypothetical protein
VAGFFVEWRWPAEFRAVCAGCATDRDPGGEWFGEAYTKYLYLF